MLKIYWTLLVMVLLTCSCGVETPPKYEVVQTNTIPRATGFVDSIVQIEGQPSMVIPHFNDSTYTIVFCVRHAEKANDGTGNPPLTDAGKERAARLGDMLSKTRIDRIGSSNIKRNLSTAEAVKVRTLEPALEVFSPELANEWMQDLLISNPGQHVLYVGHTNTIPDLLNRLAGRIVCMDIPEDEYGRLYVVVTKRFGESEVLVFNY